MIIRSSTWNRDSNELFDYESDEYYNNTFFIKKNCYIMRNNNEISHTNKYFPKYKENYLMNIFCDEDEYYIQKDMENRLTSEKVWLTLRFYISSRGDQV